MKYRKRPIVVEAFQMEWPRRIHKMEWPIWLRRAWLLPPGEEGSLFLHGEQSPDGFSLATREGVVKVSDGDWIICGIQGELYPCKPDIFAATYDAVEDE